MDFKKYWFASEKRMMQINNYKCMGGGVEHGSADSSGAWEKQLFVLF